VLDASFTNAGAGHLGWPEVLTNTTGQPV